MEAILNPEAWNIDQHIAGDKIFEHNKPVTLSAKEFEEISKQTIETHGRILPAIVAAKSVEEKTETKEDK